MSRPGALVDPDDLDVEVNMAIEKLDMQRTDDENTTQGTPDLVSREPADYAEEPEKKPWRPYCKHSMTAQQSWPFYLQRNALREYFGEFFGTFLLLLFGNSVVATSFFQTETYDVQYDSNGNPISYTYTSTAAGQSNATYLCIVFGWGMGLAMALYVSGKISGGHVNPAVTLCNAVFGNIPWTKVPFYIIAQFLGAMTGSACMYGLYRPFFNERRAIVKLQQAQGMNTSDTQVLGGLFSTYPVKPFYGNAFCFWSELLNTCVMMMVICGIGDEDGIPARKNALSCRMSTLRMKLYKQKKNAARRRAKSGGARSPDDMDEEDFDLIEDVIMTERRSGGTFYMSHKPLAVGLLIFELGIATGWCSGYALNPARDLGPRMVSAMIFRSTEPFTLHAHYFWIPMFVPILGAILGQWLYTFFICPEVVEDTMQVEDDYEEKRIFLAADSQR